MFAIRLLEGGSQSSVTWLLWVALGFFAVMVIVGWLTSRRQKPEEPEKPAHGGENVHH